MNDYQKFIILSAPRSGSTYLSDLLHHHKNILSVGEIFNQDAICGGPGEPLLQYVPLLKFMRNVSPVNFIKLFVFRSRSSRTKAVGFKLLYYQAESNSFRNILDFLVNMKNLKVIHLKRDNYLDSLVSLKLARSSGVWSSLEGSYPKNKTFQLSRQECIDHFTYVEEHINRYKSLFQNHQTLDVSYERLISSTDADLKNLLSFLGVNRCSLNSKIKKLNDKDPADRIANYHELKKEFLHTKWSKFFL